MKRQNVTNKPTRTRRTAYKFTRVPSFWSTHQTVLLNLLLLTRSSLPRTPRFLRSVPSQVVYCKLKWIIQTAGFHFVLYISRLFPSSLLHSCTAESDIAVWRKRISDGCNDNPERFPFECGPSKFLKNQQRLIGRVYDTPCQLEPPSQLFLYHVNREVTRYPLFYAVTVSCRAGLLYPNYLSVFQDLLWYLFRKSLLGYKVTRGRIRSFGFVLSIFG